MLKVKIDLTFINSKYFLLLPLFFINIVNIAIADEPLIRNVNESLDVYRSDTYKNFINDQGKINLTSVLKKFESKSLIDKDDFQFVAKVINLKDNLSETPFNLKSLIWSLDNPNENFWIQKNNRIISKKHRSSNINPLILNLTQSNFYQWDSSPNQYEELLIDYNFSAKDSSCDITSYVEFSADAFNSHKTSDFDQSVVGKSISSNLIKNESLSINIRDSNWLKKDYKYLITRLLGVGGDYSWHYTENDESSVVMQRKSNWLIDESSSIVIEHSKLSEITGVNISVGQGDFDQEILIFSVDDLKTLENGNLSAEIDVGKAILDAFSEQLKIQKKEKKSTNLFIKEIFIHFDVSNDKSFINDKNLIAISIFDSSIDKFENLDNLIKSNEMLLTNIKWQQVNLTTKFKDFFNRKTSQDDYWSWEDQSGYVNIRKIFDWELQPDSRFIIYLNSDAPINSLSLQYGLDGISSENLTIVEPIIRKLNDGKFAIILDLDNLIMSKEFLSKINQSKDQLPHLTEINIKIKNLDEGLSFNDLIYEVALLNYPKLNQQYKSKFTTKLSSLNLPSKTKKLGLNRERVIIDLSTLTKPMRGLRFSKGFLVLAPQKEMDFCDIEIESIYFGQKSHKSMKQNYLSLIETWTQKYLQIFPEELLNIDLIHGIDFNAYSSPSEFYIDQNYKNMTSIPFDNGQIQIDNISTFNDKLIPSISVVKNYLKKNTKGEIFSVDGIQLISNGEIYSANSDYKSEQFKKNLRIIGHARNATLLWPVDIKLDGNSTFYLSIPQGSDSILRINLTINSKTGEKWTKVINANKPVLLDNVAFEISSVEINFVFKNLDFDFELEELAIVSPRLINQTGVINSVVPFKIKSFVHERVLSENLIDAGRGENVDLTFWSNEVKDGSIEFIQLNPLPWADGIELDYEFPLDWLGDGCILNADFIFADNIFNRKFCLNDNSGSQILSFVELGFKSQKKLEKIIFHLQKPKGTYGLLNLNVRVIERGLSSISNQFDRVPLFYLNNKPYYLEADIVSKSNIENDFSYSLSKTFHNELLKDYGLIEANDNPWFELERISIVPKEAVSIESWLYLTTPSQLKTNSNWVSWIWYLLIILLSFKIFQLYLKPIFINHYLYFLSKFNQLKTILWIFFSKLIGRIYSAIAILFLICIVFLLLNSNNLLLSLSLSISLIIAIINVIKSYSSFGLIFKKEQKVIFPSFSRNLFISSLLVFLISGVTSPASFLLPSAIIMLAALYGVFPQIFEYLADKSRLFFDVLIYGSLIIILYTLGLFTITSSDENYFFTIGGLIVVFFWKAYISYLKPIIKINFPIFSEILYHSAGAKFLIGFILILLIIPIMLILKLNLITEQISSIGFYMLLTGLVLEILSGRSNQKNSLDS